MRTLKKHHVIEMFGSTVCPELRLAVDRDPFAPNHQELLIKYDIEGKSLAEILDSNAFDLLNDDVDEDTDCLTTCLTKAGLRFFLPLQIYYFLFAVETKREVDSYVFAYSLKYTLKSRYKLDTLFTQEQLEFLADFFILYKTECPSPTFGRRIPDWFVQLMESRSDKR